MENSPIKPSVRKQFLTKIYQRNTEISQETEEHDEKNESFNNPNSSYSSINSSMIHESSESKSPVKMAKRSSTPSLSIYKRRKSSSDNTLNMKIFTEFLSDLLHIENQIPQTIFNNINSVTKALNDNFAKNPEFSLQFYISMTGILNILNEPYIINYEDLKAKVEEAISLTNDGITEMEQLTVLKKHITKINLKVITTLKKLLTSKEEVQMISYAYLIFFSNADKDIEVYPNKKIPPTSVLGVMQKYTTMPGKMIQTCRKVVEFIHKRQIPSNCAKSSQDVLQKINEQGVMEVDRSGGMLILYDYLKACLSYYWAYTQTPRSGLSSSPSFSDKRIYECDEDIDQDAQDVSFTQTKGPRSKKSSLNATPLKNKPKLFDESRVVSEPRISIEPRISAEPKIVAESRNFFEPKPFVEPQRLGFSQQSVILKSESTKSIINKDSFENALEERFKDFLRAKNPGTLTNVISRLHIIDEFEREIRDELREKFLHRVLDETGFEEEVRKAQAE
ncbi:hypothetical protein SteCoe_23053 [Stentor coeruleus]|uniref:Uncharacterized protein n=1 Tax=Stentor coeruleus TaxID=5963 RepID=A0A1R2BKS3_9CILI|nr:hypothetical protein SteCoe_23053 [Stentor coeruleus]